MEKLKNKKLWLMCGIPGLGKSTWIQNHKKFFEGSTAIISRDQIRFSFLQEGDDYFSKEKEVWNEYVKQTIESLCKNDNTILDATHLNINSRNKILRALGKNLSKIDEINVIFFNGTLNLAIERNSQRTGLAFVPPEQIKRMFSSIQFPDKKLEPFHHIYIIDALTGKIKENIEEGE